MDYVQIFENGNYELVSEGVPYLDMDYSSSSGETIFTIDHPLYGEFQIVSEYCIYYKVVNSGGDGYYDENYDYIDHIDIEVYDYTVYHNEDEVQIPKEDDVKLISFLRSEISNII